MYHQSPLIIAVMTLSGFFLRHVSGNLPLAISATATRVQVGQSVMIRCSMNSTFSTLTWKKQTADIDIEIGQDNQLNIDFTSVARMQLQKDASFSFGSYSYTFTINPVQYQDTATYSCNMDGTKMAISIAVCDSANSDECMCLERRGYHDPSCFHDYQKDKEMSQFRAAVIVLIILLIIVIIYAIIMTGLFARDFIRTTKKRAAKKLETLKQRRENSASENPGFHDASLEQEPKRFSSKENLYHTNADGSMEDEDKYERITPEGQSSFGSSSESVPNYVGKGALGATDLSQKYAAYGARPKDYAPYRQATEPYKQMNTSRQPSTVYNNTPEKDDSHKMDTTRQPAYDNHSTRQPSSDNNHTTMQPSYQNNQSTRQPSSDLIIHQPADRNGPHKIGGYYANVPKNQNSTMRVNADVHTPDHHQYSPGYSSSSQNTKYQAPLPPNMQRNKSASVASLRQVDTTRNGPASPSSATGNLSQHIISQQSEMDRVSIGPISADTVI